MEDFFKADGLSRIIFYFQEVENLPDAGTFLESFQGWHSGIEEVEGYVMGASRFTCICMTCTCI